MTLSMALIALVALAEGLHYEKPPCGADEMAGNIQGANGTLCAPKCDAQGQCPTDMPAGAWNNATPACVLQDASGSGDRYCALTCKLVGCPTGAHCAMIGIVVGVCVYPNGTRTDALPSKELVMDTAASHPTLPNMWTAYVNELDVGKVYESENFVYGNGASTANPAAKWTNFSDGSCKRLIYSNGTDIIWSINKRFLLGCGQEDESGELACCHEKDEDGGPIEYQIPNVHPAILAPVKSLGKETITMFDGSTVDADVWSWNFLVENTKVYTTSTGNGLAQLHKWVPTVSGTPYPNEYVNYKGIADEDAESFRRSFDIPQICHKSKKCSSAKLSNKAMQFLRGDRRKALTRITQLLV